MVLYISFDLRMKYFLKSLLMSSFDFLCGLRCGLFIILWSSVHVFRVISLWYSKAGMYPAVNPTLHINILLCLSFSLSLSLPILLSLIQSLFPRSLRTWPVSLNSLPRVWMFALPALCPAQQLLFTGKI